MESVVLERSDAIHEIGAGLSLWSNALKALREIGMEASVLKSASIIERNRVQVPAGRLVTVSEFQEISQNAGAPCLCVHRAILQRLLREQLSPDAVR